MLVDSVGVVVPPVSPCPDSSLRDDGQARKQQVDHRTAKRYHAREPDQRIDQARPSREVLGRSDQIIQAPDVTEPRLPQRGRQRAPAEPVNGRIRRVPDDLRAPGHGVDPDAVLEPARIPRVRTHAVILELDRAPDVGRRHVDQPARLERTPGQREAGLVVIHMLDQVLEIDDVEGLRRHCRGRGRYRYIPKQHRHLILSMAG